MEGFGFRSIGEGLLELCQNLLLVLNDGVQGGLILKDGRLILLDRFLICLDGALVGENRFLVPQNAFLVCNYMILRHFGVLSFPKGVRAIGFNEQPAKRLAIFIFRLIRVNRVLAGR
jgi:hypothetical protein